MVSFSKTETQGLVTVEAMLSGCPVVAIGELGTVDVMQGDHGGFMVADDLEEFSGRVVELMSNQNLRKQKSKEALAWGAKWKISNLTPTLVKCYEKAVKIVEGFYDSESEKLWDEFDSEFRMEVGIDESDFEIRDGFEGDEK